MPSYTGGFVLQATHMHTLTSIHMAPLGEAPFFYKKKEALLAHADPRQKLFVGCASPPKDLLGQHLKQMVINSVNVLRLFCFPLLIGDSAGNELGVGKGTAART